jgi:cyanophycinase
MSIHLVGGGWSEDLFRHFVIEAEARAAGSARIIPRIGVLLLADDEASGQELSDRYRSLLLGIASCSPVVTVIIDGAEATSELLSDIDGLLIGGGTTPAYLEAVTGLVEEVRLLVADGLPYLGYSAGAMIAADVAIIGGWMIGDVPIGSADIGEGIDEVAVVEGLGLIDLAVDVHAAQWGTLARLIATTEAGLVDGGVAIDEETVLIVGDGTLRVEGLGSVWRVTNSPEGVLVATIGN